MELQILHGNILFQLREAWVVLDLRLAELYEIEPDVFKETVRTNIDRFPADSVFELTREEYDFLRMQFASLEREGRGVYSKYIVFGFPKNGPFAFTEQGLNILASVLNSPNVIKQNDSIVLALRVDEIFNTHNINGTKLEKRASGGNLFSDACEFVEILKYDLKTPFKKKESKDFLTLVKSDKQITKVEIIRGNVPYTFEKDKAILNLFRKTIDEFYPERLSEFRRGDDWYGFDDDVFDLARNCLEGFKTILNGRTKDKPNENAVYRIMFDLFILAKYPFTDQQKHNDKTKCALMRAWFKVNKNFTLPDNLA